MSACTVLSFRPLTGPLHVLPLTGPLHVLLHVPRVLLQRKCHAADPKSCRRHVFFRVYCDAKFAISNNSSYFFKSNQTHAKSAICSERSSYDSGYYPAISIVVVSSKAKKKKRERETGVDRFKKRRLRKWRCFNVSLFKCYLFTCFKICKILKHEGRVDDDYLSFHLLQNLYNLYLGW